MPRCSRPTATPVDERVGEIVRAAIKHLYAFAEEVGLTREEWFGGIDFLTAVGQKCDDQRQEFVLLSDTLGLSMLVEMINQKGAEGTTDPTVFGPVPRTGRTPEEMGDTILVDDDPGPQLTFRGTVRDLDGHLLDGAELDVWQSGIERPVRRAGSESDADQPARPLPHRARTAATSSAAYDRSPISIPGDGPVGTMLGATGRHNWRPAHTHVVVSAPGYKTIITHLFDSESDYLDSDTVFGVRDSLVVDMSSGVVDYDFVLERAD